MARYGPAASTAFSGMPAGHWKNYTRANGLSNREIISLGAGRDGKMWIGYRHGGGIDRIRVAGKGAAIEKAVQRRGTDGIVVFSGIRFLRAALGGYREGRGPVGWIPLEPLRFERRVGVGRLQPERVRRGGGRHSLDRNQRWTLPFQGALRAARRNFRPRSFSRSSSWDGRMCPDSGIHRSASVRTLSRQDTPC